MWHRDNATARRLLACCMLCLAAQPAWPVTGVSGLNDIDLGSWSPAAGNPSASDDFCVETAFIFLGFGTYSALVSPLDGATFALRSATVPGVSLAATVTFQDLITGVTDTLVPSQYSGVYNGVRNCNSPNNARLTVSLSAADLAAVPPGDYVAPLRFTSRTYLSASSNFEARIRVLGLVRVSGLDAIDLGDFDGINDLAGGDQFCIYSNNGSGAYTVTASGQGAGGAFTVSTGADTIPLALEYDDGSGYAALNPLSALTRGNASTGSVDCGGGSNANVRVAARAADMQAALSGAYVGEITFTVAPL